MRPAYITAYTVGYFSRCIMSLRDKNYR
jgi:hypothetical protein